MSGRGLHNPDRHAPTSVRDLAWCNVMTIHVWACCGHCGISRGYALPGERHLPHTRPCPERDCQQGRQPLHALRGEA